MSKVSKTNSLFKNSRMSQDTAVIANIDINKNNLLDARQILIKLQNEKSLEITSQVQDQNEKLNASILVLE